jgi:hypothetical protein
VPTMSTMTDPASTTATATHRLHAQPPARAGTHDHQSGGDGVPLVEPCLTEMHVCCQLSDGPSGARNLTNALSLARMRASGEYRLALRDISRAEFRDVRQRVAASPVSYGGP